MRIIVTILIFVFYSNLGKAQVTYSPNTFYVIPPSNGCDGLWAIQTPVGCSQYLMNPCWQAYQVHGDTTILHLCSLPCQYYAVTDSGSTCYTAFCDYANGIKLKTNINNLIIRFDNDELIFGGNINSYNKFEFYTIEGSLILSSTTEVLKNNRFNVNDLENGVYFIRVYSKSGEIFNRKVLLVR